jgi:hypothetical protein
MVDLRNTLIRPAAWAFYVAKYGDTPLNFHPGCRRRADDQPSSSLQGEDDITALDGALPTPIPFRKAGAPRLGLEEAVPLPPQIIRRKSGPRADQGLKSA